MQLTFERRANLPGESFRCIQREAPTFEFLWHYQNDYELVVITAGHGRRFIGDHIGPYGPGDLVLVGPGLPHTWVSFRGPGAPVALQRAVYVQFDEDFLGTDFFSVPELEPVARLLERSRRGLRMPVRLSDPAAAGLARLPSLEGLARLTQLLQVLHAMSRAPELEVLASEAYAFRGAACSKRRIETACAYIHSHYRDPIRLADVAAHVRMTASALARLFKRSTDRTVSQYANALRVGHACSLLMSTDMPITAIAYESGFRSLPYFNRRFRQLKGASPREFRQPSLPAQSLHRCRRLPDLGHACRHEQHRASSTRRGLLHRRARHDGR